MIRCQIQGKKLLKYKHMEAKQHALNKQQIKRRNRITEEIKKETKICIETNENENTTTKTYGIQ